MFKVFKKKSKSSGTPTFGSSGKSKSLFSLSKSGEKRKSASSVALDKENPVQTISLQYQYDYADQDIVVQSSRSNQNHGFKSFLGDEVIGNGYHDNWNKLSHDRSQSADALDQIGHAEVPAQFTNGYIPKNTRSKSRNTWQGSESPTLSTSRGKTASLFLEQIHHENDSHTPSTKFSTFKSSALNTASTDSGYKSGEVGHKMVDIPIPEGFTTPCNNRYALSRLPPELDAMSIRSSQYEASVIMPPKGFNDTITESVLQHTDPSQSWIVQSDHDSISINSTDSCQSDSSAHVQKRPLGITKSLSQEMPSCVRTESSEKLQPQSSYPTLPPKPNVTVYHSKHNPMNVSSGTNVDKSKPNQGISNGINEQINECAPESPANSVNVQSVSNSELLTKNSNNHDHEAMKHPPTSIEDVSLKPKPTPPPRRNRAGTVKNPPLVKDVSTTSDSSSNSLMVTTAKRGYDVEDVQMSGISKVGKFEPDHEVRSPSSIGIDHANEASGIFTNADTTKAGQVSRNENVETKLHVIPSPMITSLREQMKLLPSKPQVVPSSPQSTHHVISMGNDTGNVLPVDTKLNENVSSKPPVGKANVKKSSVSTFQEPLKSVAILNEIPVNGENPDYDLDITLSVNTRKIPALDTSSRLSNFGEVEICSLSSINESPQIMISDSFLDDTALSSYEQSDVDSDDSDVDFNVMVTLNDEYTQEQTQRNTCTVINASMSKIISHQNTSLDTSSNIILSDSFLNDTVTPVLNTSIPGMSPLADTAIIVEDDYIPQSLSADNKRVKAKDNPPDQPWEVSMAMSWGRTNQEHPKSQMSIRRRTYSESIDSTDSESTVAGSYVGDAVQTRHSVVYRWQQKPVLLWDVEEVCQWLETRDLGDLNPLMRENELSGLHLLQMHLLDLGELTSNEKLRQKLLHDVQDLRDPHGSLHMASIKKISMRRKDLEVSNEVLAERLHNLSWLNEQQQTTIGNYLEQLGQEQTEADVLLSDDPSDGYIKLPIIKWSNYDVLAWLESVGMEKFSPTFKAHGIVGQDLVSIDMELLDSLGISSIQDRELILSRLYELQHPETTNAGNVARLKEIFQQPPSLDSDTTSDMSKSSSRSAARRLFSEEEKIYQDNISERSLKIWHDVTGSPAETMLTVTSQMTSLDVIVKVLRDNDVHIDANLFALTRVTMDSNTGKVCTSNLCETDCPAVVHKGIVNSDTKARLELRSKSTRKVKVHFDLDTEISTCKQLYVSSMCTCGELLNMALSAFSLSDMETYNIQALDDNGVKQPVGATKLLLMYDCDAFQLVEKQETVDIITRSSYDQLEGPGRSMPQSCVHPREAITPEVRSPDPVRPPVVTEHDWASVTGTEIQLDPDLTTMTDDLDLEKLSTLSDDLDCLSIVTHSYNNPDTGRNYTHEQSNVFTFHSNGFNVTKYQEQLEELQEGLQEKDKIIQRLQLENEAAQVERKQAHDLWSLFSTMERDMKQRQADLQAQYVQQEKELATVRNKTITMPGDEEEVDILQQALMVSGQQIQLVEQRESLLQAQLGTARANIRSDPSIMEQLKHQLSETDACLLDLKQQQADIYRQLKMARKQLLKMQKSSIDLERFNMYKLLQELGHNPSVLQQVIAVNIDPAHNKCDFILGHNHINRPIIKHAEDNSLLQKGDRIIEVNGSSVTHLNELELTKQLKQGHGNLSVVVLRKTTNYELKVQEKVEEAESIREDLSLTMMELETAQDESKELLDQVEQSNAEHKRAEQRNYELKSHAAELEDQLLQHKQEVQAQMEQFKEQLQEKDKEIQVLKDQNSSSTKAALQVLRRTSSALCRRSDSGVKTMTEDDIKRLHNSGTLQDRDDRDDEGGDIVLSYEDYGQDPIWESLQQAPKNEILQALKDQVLENQQQKAYLDHLLTAVIDHAPNLVHVVDQCIGVEDHSSLNLKTRSEEFC